MHKRRRKKKIRKTSAMLNIHAKRRALERHGIELNKKLRFQFIENIKNKYKAILLVKQSNTRSIWAIQYGIEWIPIVYNNQYKTIATVLPKDALSKYGKSYFGNRYLEEI